MAGQLGWECRLEWHNTTVHIHLSVPSRDWRLGYPIGLTDLPVKGGTRKNDKNTQILTCNSSAKSGTRWKVMGEKLPDLDSGCNNQS
jgi:hypothetical protein